MSSLRDILAERGVAMPTGERAPTAKRSPGAVSRDGDFIVHDVEQGSEAWHKLRVGIPTSSEFSKILSPGGELSISAEPYMYALIAERLMGHPVEHYKSSWMERGKEIEAEAADYYSYRQDVDVERIGFITNRAGTVGVSPDRVVGESGLLEIKCPSEHVHVSYIYKRDLDKKHYSQIQGQLWISEREWVDIISYHPDLPWVLIRVQRDEKYISTLAEAVTRFCEVLESLYSERF